MQRYDVVLMGVLMALLSLVGLLIAAQGEDRPFQLFGAALFIFGVVFDFGLIRRYIGRAEGEAD